MKEKKKLHFKLNQFLSLELRNNRTVILVDGKEFRQCTHLVMKIPVEDLKDTQEIQSIDEFAEIYGRGPELRSEHDWITPKEEFWGHCSNLQAWVEHDYDTRILHRNLAFPLLKKLNDLGDTVAKRKFKDEVIQRFLSGHFPVMKFLNERGYLKSFTKEELKVLILDALRRSRESTLKFLIMYRYYKHLGKEELELYKIFQKLFSLKPEDMNDAEGILKVFFYFKMYEEVISLCSKFITMGIEPERMDYYLGRAYLLKENYQEAITHFKSCIAHKLNLENALVRLCYANECLGKYEGVEQCINELFKLNTAHSEANYYLGNLCVQKKRYQKALEYYTKAYPHYRREHKIWAKRAEIYFELGKMRKALKACNYCLLFKQEYKNIADLREKVYDRLEREEKLLSQINPDLFRKIDEFL